MTKTYRQSERLSTFLNFYQNKLRKAQSHRLSWALLTLSAWLMLSLFSSNDFKTGSSPLFEALQWLSLMIMPAFFIVLVIRSRRFKRFTQRLEILHDFYLRQEERKDGKIPDSHQGEDRDHPLDRDLNLVSKNSLLGLIDETLTPEGRQRLCHEILDSRRNVNEILDRQILVKKLCAHSSWLRRWVVEGRLHQKEHQENTHDLKNLLKEPLVEKSFYRHYAILKILFLGNIATLVALFSGHIFWPWWFFPIAHGFYCLWSYSSIEKSFSKSQSFADRMQALKPIFDLLEEKSSENDFLDLLDKTRQFAPAEKIRKLAKTASFLSVEAHFLVHALIHICMPWSFYFSDRLEKLRQIMKDQFPDCLDELYQLEVISSLVFMTTYQTNSWPIPEQDLSLKFEDLYHPLIPREEVKANTFSHKGEKVHLITGSNMSGKSTFLRTLGLNHRLMHMGAPVFAKSYTAHPFQLITCLRVSDSLSDGFSYFYAEVTRLKEVLDSVQSQSGMLYLVDEIFKGTNNVERLQGSQALLEVLAQSSAIGFVTTHDLELAQMADRSEKMRNLHFRDDVLEGKMHFPYQIYEGPCPTTNALKIMKEAGLPV